MEDDLFDGSDDAKADLSPMIDLVFLLLIFFIVTAQIVQYKKDPAVQMPKAKAATIADNIKDRLVINIYKEGTIKDEDGKTLSLDQFRQVVVNAKSKEPKTKLLLRADARVPYGEIKKVSQAAAKGGIPNIIFATKE